MPAFTAPLDSAEKPKTLEVVVSRRYRSGDPTLHYTTMPLVEFLRMRGIVAIYRDCGLTALQWPG